MSTESQPLLRTLLVLGRVSNLPTVWTNCLAGWVLGGGGELNRLLILCAGASAMYIGGMYLNDAFDVAWDHAHKNDRPIPSGHIPERPVWILGWLLLLGGLAPICMMGERPALLGIQLGVCILAYDALHKHISWSPFLMAGCRFYLLLVAASAASDGINGLAIWMAVVLGAYILGLSYVAKAESLPGPLQYWPLIFLASPIALAFLVNDEEFRRDGLLVSAILGLWIIRSLRNLFWTKDKKIGKAVCGLLAGICLVDLLAVAFVPPMFAGLFIAGFLLSLLFQRYVPAT